MHDDHVLIEQRLHRTLSRVERAVYSKCSPLDVAIWPVAGEPVPVAEALAAEYAPARVGRSLGSAVGDNLVPSHWHRSGATGLAARSRRLIDIGFDVDRTGFHAEGLVYRREGRR